MKKFICFSVVFAFTCNLMMSQPINHSNGGEYLKRIEYNVLHSGATDDEHMYNLEHKSVIDRLFFGSRNSFVEFVLEDTPEGSNEATALRIIKKQNDNSYELEVMRLQNLLDVYYEKLMHVVSEKTTPIFAPFWLSSAVSSETKNRINEHNKEANSLKHSDELYKPYRPEPIKLEVSRELAEKLHEKTSMLIDNFKGVGTPLNINGGFRVTFRCVVDDELWTLSVHYPDNRTVLRLSDLFRQIITDSIDGKMDETKYLKLPDKIL